MINRRILLAGAISSVATTATAQGYVGGSLGPKNPPPCETPNECGFVSSATRTLLGYYPTVIKRDGTVITNADPNKTTYTWHCIQCGKTSVE